MSGLNRDPSTLKLQRDSVTGKIIRSAAVCEFCDGGFGPYKVIINFDDFSSCYDCYPRTWPTGFSYKLKTNLASVVNYGTKTLLYVGNFGAGTRDSVCRYRYIEASNQTVERWNIDYPVACDTFDKTFYFTHIQYTFERFNPVFRPFSIWLRIYLLESADAIGGLRAFTGYVLNPTPPLPPNAPDCVEDEGNLIFFGCGAENFIAGGEVSWSH